ncbi:hypothetical protein K470DRAFT_256187 [Piedraia hortae CBS 480.64]|uniref:Uncharacterized protein n=1 Tax=Piedraia hortae CBS 480.64 TaxID=1314780 RepID=A0A6A7C4C9_9PEZI|nr:hypothetical protein K470DRAFT_256187 [Piedraia hortae CBS 480.64]
MGLSARERRRIKNLIDVLPPIETRGWDEAVDYHNALTVKPPVEHNVPMSAGGVSRVSYELEARKRFAQPLAQETQEIPSQSEVQARLEPISHCEGVTGTSPNTVQACAELVEQGLEVYVKELMGSLMTYAWSGSDGCIKPAKRRKLNSAEPPGNSPIDMRDVRLALDHNEPYLRRDPFMAETCQIKAPPRHKETANGRRQSTRMDAGNQEDTSWPGGGKRSREDLRRLLDGCLGA